MKKIAHKFKLYLNRKYDPVYFSLCECGYEICKPLHKVGPLKRKFYLLHFITSGTGYYKVDKTYNLEKGDVFLIKPEETIEYCSDKTDPWTYYWIGFESPHIKNLLDKLFKDSHVLHLENINWILKIFLEISKCDYKNEISQFYITSKLYEIVYYLFKTNKLEFSSNENDTVSKVLQYINDHINEELTVSLIAKHFGFSRSRLFTLMKEEMGISLKEYISNAKLDKAYILLEQNQNLSVQEISWLVGFSNYETFFKAFKKRYKKSPSSIKIDKTKLHIK